MRSAFRLRKFYVQTLLSLEAEAYSRILTAYRALNIQDLGSRTQALILERDQLYAGVMRRLNRVGNRLTRVMDMKDPGLDDALDGTDGAHPAWWRGSDDAVAHCVRIMERAIDGFDGGKVGDKGLERIRRWILDRRSP